MGIKPFGSNPWIHGYQTFCIKPLYENLWFMGIKPFWFMGIKKSLKKKEDIKMDDQKK
jgi:hypothetical protein